MLLIILLQVLIIVLLAVYINHLVVIEKFTAGYGTTFGHYFYPSPPCTNDTNCFKGFQSRGATYTNMCEPRSLEIPGLGVGIGIGNSSGRYIDKLLRTKRPLKEECIRIY